MQSFALSDCAFHFAAGVGFLSNLTKVALSSVHITGEEGIMWVYLQFFGAGAIGPVKLP